MWGTTIDSYRKTPSEQGGYLDPETPEPLVVRGDPPLDSQTIVVRGGLMARRSTEASAVANHHDYGFYGVSVFARNGTSARALWEETQEIAKPRYKQVRTA